MATQELGKAKDKVDKATEKMRQTIFSKIRQAFIKVSVVRDLKKKPTRKH